MANVRLDAIRKVYPNGQVAVQDASFEAADGELLVLVGPSGCGKSTLLRMIAGLEVISAGTLSIGDRVVNDVAPRDRDIAMVFQSYALYPHMTVAQNLAFGLRLRGHGKAQVAARIAAAAETLGLEAMLDKLPRELSGGQRQRVALGRALVREPVAFLLDEPLSNLDARLRHSVRSEIARLHRQLGTTMIYVTHDQVEAMTLGQRIVVMDQGVIQQVDTPMAVYERPVNLFVAGFMGSPAMNRVAGRLESGTDGPVLRLADGVGLPLGAAARPPAGWTGRDLVLGVRPEHIVPMDPYPGVGAGAATAGRAGTDLPLAATFEARVEAIEPVGNEVFVTLQWGAQALTVRMPPRELPGVGLTLCMALVGERLHYFDPGTGRALPSPG